MVTVTYTCDRCKKAVGTQNELHTLTIVVPSESVINVDGVSYKASYEYTGRSHHNAGLCVECLAKAGIVFNKEKIEKSLYFEKDAVGKLAEAIKELCEDIFQQNQQQ